MNPLIVVCLAVLSCGYSTALPVFGVKRYHRANPTYSQQQAPQYYDTSNYPQYMSPYPQPPLQRISDYYYNPREYQYYGMPTYHGEYNKPNHYYYAHPSYSYSEEDRVESNPLDDLHEEILQENERERSREFGPVMAENWYGDNSPQLRPQQQLPVQPVLPQYENNNDYTNAAFMRNLVMYNKQLDRMHNSNDNNNQDLQSLDENSGEFDDYEESPVDNSDWYDVVSSLNTNNNANNGLQQRTQVNTYQQPKTNSQNSDYDEEVKQLKELKSHRYDSAPSQSQSQMGYNPYENQNQYDIPSYVGRQNWQNNMGGVSPYEGSYEPEYEDTDWINWERKRDIQPKKDFGIFGLTEIHGNNNNENSESGSNKKPTETHIVNNKFEKNQPTRTPQKEESSTQVSNDLPTKTHKGGQKEVVLPRPATPVRKPFTDSVMKMLESKTSSTTTSKTKKSASEPIYDTIQQLFDMEQNLDHLNDNQLPTSKIQKRFVINEEALVQQLNGLKRTSQ